jgi:hypothetical protein
MRCRLAFLGLVFPVICTVSVAQHQGDALNESKMSDITPVPQSVALRVKFQYLEAFGGLPCPFLSREQLEEDVQRSRVEFGNIASDSQTYGAILKQFGMEGLKSLNEDEKLIVYCVYRSLQSLQVMRKARVYRITVIQPRAPRQSGYKSAGYIEVDDEGRVQIMGVVPNTGFGTPQGLTMISPAKQEKGGVGSSGQQEPAPPPQRLSLPWLRYKLLEKYQVAFCYPFRPVLRLGEVIDMVHRDKDTYQAIMRHLGLSESHVLTVEEQHAVYQEFLKLNAIELQPLVTRHEFAVSISSVTVGSGRGTRIFGIIDDEGRNLVLYSVPASVICPA